MKRALGVALAALLTGLAGEARADSNMNQARLEINAAPPPRSPAPFILPELAHDRLDLGLDWFYGRLQTVNGTLRNDTPAGMMRAAAEVNILPRRLYLGVAYPIGFAMPPDGGLAQGEVGPPAGSRALAGNISAHIRAVFALPTFLEIGFILDAIAPTATFDRDARGNLSAVNSFATLDPTTYLDFLPGRVALRPAGDLRITRGPLVFQGRHGLDIIIDGNGVETVNLAGRLLGHFGYVVYPSLEVSLEASQLYFFTSQPTKVTAATTPVQQFSETYRLKDGNRSALTIGPAIRAMTTNFDYGLAFITNIADPISPVGERMLGLRFSIIAHLPNRH